MSSSPTATTAALLARVPPSLPGDDKELLRLGFDKGEPPCLWHRHKLSDELVNCAVIVTAYRIVLVPHSSSHQVILIPLLTLDHPPETKQAQGIWPAEWRGTGSSPVWQVELRLKTPFTFTLAFRDTQLREAEGLVKLVSTLIAQYKKHLHAMFAFKHADDYREQHEAETLEDGWKLYDIERELERQVGPERLPGYESEWEGRGLGINLRPWYRIAQLEPAGEEGVSPTYPNRFVVPREATDKLIHAITAFRSRARVPMISYVMLSSGASLSRASQPLTGAWGSSVKKGKRCEADEIMLESLLPSQYLEGGTPLQTTYKGSVEGRQGSEAEAASTDSPRSPSPAALGRPPPLTGGPKKGGPPPSLGVGRPPPLTGRPPPLSSGGAAAASGTTTASGRNTPPAEGTVKEADKGAEAAQKKGKKRQMVIFDARSLLAAKANMGRGGGYEDLARNYRSSRLFFLDMGNVHAVTRSWEKIRDMHMGYNNNANTWHNAEYIPGNSHTNHHFLKDWEESGWVLHCQRLIWGANRIVEEMSRGNSCLVHCSDGWDRTAQLTSTAMILIDPYYRTIRGFATLVQKEWEHAGHKFAERSGHQVSGTMQQSPYAAQMGTGNDADDEDKEAAAALAKEQAKDGIAKHTRHGSKLEQSPIFCQWLDAMWQLLRQFPRDFEFAPALLEFLAEHVYSGRFGSFLCNFDKERVGEGLKERTISVWTEVLRMAAVERAGGEHGEPPILNPMYEAVESRRVLRASANTKRLSIWESLWLRYDIEAVSGVRNREAFILAELTRWKKEALRLRGGGATPASGSLPPAAGPRSSLPPAVPRQVSQPPPPPAAAAPTAAAAAPTAAPAAVAAADESSDDELPSPAAVPPAAAAPAATAHSDPAPAAAAAADGSSDDDDDLPRPPPAAKPGSPLSPTEDID